MKTYKFQFKPWDGTDNDIFIEEIRAVNILGAWEKAHAEAKNKQCTILFLLP